MQNILRPMVTEGIATASDLSLLGFSANNLGNFEEALWFFEQIEGNELRFQFERIFYCNQCAYSLIKLGRHAEAAEHIRQFDRSRWPRKDRDWADAVASKRFPENEPPSTKPENRKVLH